jgi:hypothetical protein
MINLLLQAYALKVVSEQIWNNVLASDFISVLFIRPLSKNIIYAEQGYEGQT